MRTKKKVHTAFVDRICKNGQEAKHAVYAMGLTLREFAAANDFSYRTVSEVVRGVSKGLYGEGREVAVALGLREGSAA